MKSSRFASLGWTPHPVAYVGCGSYNAINEGCTAETDDAQAAYTHALLWYFTGDKAHAEKSKQILNAWSAVLKDHRFDTKVYKNGLLQAGWAGQTFTKAAELLRYSGAGWSTAEVSRFETMLRTAFLPRVRNGWTWMSANWQLTMAEATMNIGVFTNDRAVYDDGVGDWRNHVKGSFYLASDGPKPYFPTSTIMKDSNYLQYWASPTKFVSGLGAETCRDASHLAMGLAAALNGAETARTQGLDLYGEQRERLVTAMEFNARFINDPAAGGWVCPKPFTLGGSAYTLTWGIGYNHYARRLGTAMPQTQRLLGGVSPTGSGIFMNWETLTHSAG
nr:alginate lyase family protein [Kineococcus siccus]